MGIVSKNESIFMILLLLCRQILVDETDWKDQQKTLMAVKKAVVGIGNTAGTDGTRRLKRKSSLPDPKSVQKVQEGDKRCNTCQKDFPSNAALVNHIARFHQNQYKYTCQEPNCTRGFMTKEGIASHAKTHNPQDKISCTVPGCDSKFSSTKSLFVHKKKYHTDQPTT